MLSNQPSAALGHVPVETDNFSLLAENFIASLPEDIYDNHSKKVEDFLTSHASTSEARAKLRQKLIQSTLKRIDIFFDIWEVLQDEVVLEDLLVQTQEDQRSALLVLAFGIYLNVKSQEFLKVWSKFQDEIKFADFLIPAKGGIHDGATALWFLAAAPRSEFFLKIFEKFKSEMKNNKLEVLFNIPENVQGKIRLEDLLTPLQDGLYKDTSVLWVLALAARYGRTEAFLRVWEVFQGEIKLTDLLVTAQNGAHKGQSVLSLLACAASYGIPEAFLKVWETFKGKIKLTDLTIQAQEDLGTSISVLRSLAEGVALGKPEAFLSVWEKFESEIKLSDLTVQAQESPDKGKSAFWFLAQAAAKGHPEAFLQAWKKFQGEITIADLTVQAQEGPDKDKSALSMLSRACPELVKNILQQVPGMIPHTLIDDDDLGRTLTANSLLPLVQARNMFFLDFNLYKKSALAQNIKIRCEKAKKAQEAGYLNAFYDVAELFFMSQKYVEAYHAYKEVPPTSCHFEKVNLKLAEHYFSLAMGSNIENKRQYHLRESLKYALQTTDSVRVALIQRIAFIYIGCDSVGVKDIVPDGWLEAMHSETSLDWCFERLDEIKVKVTLEKENKELKQKMAMADKTLALLFSTNEAQAKEITALKERIKVLEQEDLSPDSLNECIEQPAHMLLAFSRQESSNSISAKRKDVPLSDVQDTRPGAKAMRSNFERTMPC